MKKLLFLLIILFPMNFSTAYGEDQNRSIENTTIPFGKTLGLIDTVSISVSDQVTGGCWTNVTKVKERIRFRFLSGGIDVIPVEDIENIDINHPVAYVTVLGGRSNEYCVVSYSFTIEYRDNIFYTLAKGTHFYSAQADVELYEKNGILAKVGNLSNDILETYNSIMDSFLADYLSAAKDVKVIEAKQNYNAAQKKLAGK